MFATNKKNTKIITKKCDGESRQKIEQKLSDIRNVIDLEKIDCTFSEKEIIFDQYSISEIEDQMEMWKYLSKLSIYLYNDYELFSQFIIKQGVFNNKLFESEMKRLGYIRKAKAWFQKQKPEEEVIISNIFNYCFTRFIFNSISVYQIGSINFSDPSSYWICDKCTYRNSDLISVNCSVCGSRRNSITEECDFKYIRNDNASNEKEKLHKADRKDITEFLRSDKVKDKSKENSFGWNCDKCSYLNKDINDVICSLCNAYRISNDLIEYSKEKNEIHDNEVLKHIKRDSSSLESNLQNLNVGNLWTCNSCTFLNQVSAKICEVCMATNEKIVEAKDLELPEEEWICKQCKTSNSFDRYKCSNCKELADFFNKWVCEMCRFFNDKSAIKCGACENKNPNIVKCSQCKEKCDDRSENDVIYLQKSQELLIHTEKIFSVEYQKEKDDNEIRRCKLPMVENIIKHGKSVSSDAKRDKRCINFIYCKGKLTINDLYWCQKCEDSRWFCPNEDCGTINFMNKYCKKCKVEKDSNVINCKCINVLKDNKPTQMWMCGFCNQYSIWAYNRCSNCKNQQDSPSHKKCRCGWNNEPHKDKCDKCGKINKKVRKY